MNKSMLLAMTGVLISLISGCTTERHYHKPPTVIHEERTSTDARSEAREGARQGAREGAHDTLR